MYSLWKIPSVFKLEYIFSYLLVYKMYILKVLNTILWMDSFKILVLSDLFNRAKSKMLNLHGYTTEQKEQSF